MITLCDIAIIVFALIAVKGFIMMLQGENVFSRHRR